MFSTSPVSIASRKKFSVKFLFLLNRSASSSTHALPWLSQTHIPQNLWFMQQHLMLPWYPNTGLWCGLYFALAVSLFSEIKCSLPKVIKPSQLRIPRICNYLFFMFTLIFNGTLLERRNKLFQRSFCWVRRCRKNPQHPP